MPHRPKEEIQFSLAGVEVNLLLAGIFLLLSLLVPAARRLWLQSGRRRRKLLHEGARGIGFLFLFLFVRLAQVLLFAVIAMDIISPVFSMAALLWRYT